MARILVTGGAGFLGSHLCDLLIDRGDTVVCLDDLSTGRLTNLEQLCSSRRFSFIEASVLAPLNIGGSFDGVIHLACPASPPEYLQRPVFTLRTGAEGTRNVLEFAGAKSARFILASTSEIYGEPLIHPQSEDYWGNVNPVGPRSVYDEAKRYAEALTTAYRTSCDADTGIVRIFNTYGPRMRSDDGRVVSSFIHQALCRAPLTVFGDGSQTRSLCYVDDLVRGIAAMLDSREHGPINLGNPVELTVRQIAELVRELVGSASRIELHPLPQDDPTRRRPDITRARERLGWSPHVPVQVGIARTIDMARCEFRQPPARPAASTRVGCEAIALDKVELT
ncbi:MULTISPECIES: NAD-dependent epimerase/dehydratase family protein [unclassified Mycobacterium]|uniref:NAD-dependent epimerase/dehydratase family protein n=1 Tax=unclassified Mycobacterium TaxID=2642494 RepID=UPI0029C82261|nr:MULTISPECIES: NAD-dependent epimerase/dehydratase family protein [unclassified Mycobacterium]